MPDPARSARGHRRLLTSILIAVLVLGVAVVLMNRAASVGAERAELVRSWSADLDAWSASTLDRIGPTTTPSAHGHDLAALFEADLTRPVRIGHPPDPVEPAALDAINAACTAVTSAIDTVRDAVQPPAPPAGLDTEHPDASAVAQRFTDYQQMLGAAQQRTGAVEPAARVFCGTYPALLAAHIEATEARGVLEAGLTCTEDGCALAAGADIAAMRTATEAGAVVPNERISASLHTQCYLTDLQPVCAADATAATDLAQAWRTWAQRTDDDAADLTQVAAAQAQAEEAFAEAAGDVVGSRADVQRRAREELTEIGSALTGSAEDVATTLRAPQD